MKTEHTSAPTDIHIAKLTPKCSSQKLLLSGLSVIAIFNKVE